MKMEATYIVKASVEFEQTTWCNFSVENVITMAVIITNPTESKLEIFPKYIHHDNVGRI
jgi:hypothetical protein